MNKCEDLMLVLAMWSSRTGNCSQDARSNAPQFMLIMVYVLGMKAWKAYVSVLCNCVINAMRF
jgi:hypothetical protein